MKLWLISQTVNTGYDTYDSAVVAAENELAAQQTHPGGSTEKWDDPWSGWCESPTQVTAELIGQAWPGIEAGIILSSFNAG